MLFLREEKGENEEYVMDKQNGGMSILTAGVQLKFCQSLNRSVLW